MDKEKKSTEKPQLVIASRNMHKIREIKSILSNYKLNLDILSLLDFPKYTPPNEIHDSFEENSNLKALHAAKALNKWTISDDSGLTVPALNGEPGIYSARYAGNSATDKDNRKKLLAKMENLKENDRFAFFTCCISIANPEGLKKSVCATCEGTIETKEKGGGGFGYDPLFIKHDYNKTFAELTDEIKNKISARGKALDKASVFLETIK